MPYPHFIIAVIIAVGGLVGSTHTVHAQSGNSIDLRFCKSQKDLQGIWKLSQLSEEPAGVFSKAKAQNPHQYIQFKKDGLFYSLQARKNIKSAPNLRKRLVQSTGQDVWQYLVAETGGVVYLYKNQVFERSYHCGRVKNDGGGYKKGSLVLTPTEQSESTVYLTYTKAKLRRRQVFVDEGQLTKNRANAR